MTPVCPSCRSPIALDARVCGHCGQAVRPTCSACGEALTAGIAACTRCGRSIDQATPAPSVPPATQVVAPPPAPSPAPQQPVAMPPMQPVAAAPVRKRRSLLGHLLLVGIAAGLLVAIALLALELTGTRLDGNQPEEVDLVQRSFNDLGFAISHPSRWNVERRTVEGLRGVSFIDPAQVKASKSQRGFHVLLDDVSIAKVRTDVEDLFRRKHKGYRKIDLFEVETVARRAAVLHVFADEQLLYEQWWVRRGMATFRVEFWSVASDQEEAHLLNEEIIDSFRTL